MGNEFRAEFEAGSKGILKLGVDWVDFVVISTSRCAS